MESPKENKKPEKKPAVSAEEIIKILSAEHPEEAPKKNYAPGEGFDWSPADEEETTLTRWLDGEEVRYEDK